MSLKKEKRGNIFFLTGRERKNFPEMKSRGKNHRLEHAISDPVPIGSGYEADAKPIHQPSGLSRQAMKVRKDPTITLFLVLMRKDRNKGEKHQTKKQ